MKNLRFILLVILSIALFLGVHAQESLQEKYDYLIKSAETYEKYKVIPKTRLEEFRTLLIDSVSRKNQEIFNLENRLDYEHKVVAGLKAEAEQFQSELDHSLAANSTIFFLGLSFSKQGYHIMVWSLIIILIFMTGFAYSMYFRSNRLTVRHRKNLEEVESEYKQHRTSAREQQAKLRRELQTAINKLESRGKVIN
ncbi:MAG: hypothetical protein GDA51_05295 [Ekhidna sp.]|nr:hypothetical protein [Ekhidna sp.]MBC6410202.1 hypothetical protein [Ekhidna sp.]MBC6425878.1 hypothetical protein [Ekhidna sp.]